MSPWTWLSMLFVAHAAKALVVADTERTSTRSGVVVIVAVLVIVEDAVRVVEKLKVVDTAGTTVEVDVIRTVLP